MFRGGRRGTRRRGRWGGHRGRGNFKRYGNRNQNEQETPQQQESMYMPQTYGSSESSFFNGYSFLGNDAMENRDMRFSSDDYMEHVSPFKTSLTQMTSFQSPPTRGKKKNKQKRQREDSQSSNGMMPFSRPNKPPFMPPMTPFQMPMQHVGMMRFPFTGLSNLKRMKMDEEMQAHAGMMRFPSPFAALSNVKRMKMDEEMQAPPLPPGQGQSKKALRRKRLRQKQKMEEEAKKAVENETVQTDVEAKEEVEKKVEDGGPKKERKFRRKPFFVRWVQKPFQCHYCRKDTQSFEGLEEHVKTPEHEAAVKEKDQRSKTSIGIIYERNEQRVHALMMMGKTPKFCSLCMLKYCGPINNHKSGRDHQSMMRLIGRFCVCCEMYVSGVTNMDKHNITTSHIRNSINRLIMNGKLPEEDLDAEEHDPEKAIGRNYVVDTRSHYCQPCDKYMKIGETDILEHCKSAEHFEKFKEFAKVRKLVEEERKRAKEAAEEERKKKEQEEGAKAEEADEEACQENDVQAEEDEVMEQEEAAEAEAAE